MGRELKRVALDFDWALGETWTGYLNPYYDLSTECDACEGIGYSILALALYKLWYSHLCEYARETAMRAELSPAKDKVIEFIDRILDQPPIIYHSTHHSRSWADHIEQSDIDVLWEAGRLFDFGSKAKGDPKPTVAQVNAWNIMGMGHDSINHHICLKARAEEFGFDITCPVCGGDGQVWPNKATLHLAESWKAIEPPEGDGYQLWENVSEGSPVSPVFGSADELVNWMADNGYTREGAESFMNAGYAPSFIGMVNSDGTGYFTNGVDASAMSSPNQD